jgi:hypothetical protein
MKSSIKHALAAVFAAASTLPATVLAAEAITTTVTPLSAAVTYSVPATATRAALDTYIGYRVRVANTGTVALSGATFAGTLAATDTDERPSFASAEGASCHADADTRTVKCELGPIAPGAAWPEFVVFFRAPAKDTASPLPDGVAGSCTTTDCAAFGGYTVFTTQVRSRVRYFLANWATAPVTLGTFNPSLVTTAVPRTGGTVFTGSGAIPTPQDQFTTAVAVPAGPSFTTAQIAEQADGQACSNNFSDCFRADVTIPGTFSPYLTIVLRQDKSTIVKGANIASVLVKYFDENGAAYIVGDCASPTTPRSDGLPCVVRRTHYSTSSVPGWTPDLDGDFEWTLINLKNGSYKVF